MVASVLLHRSCRCKLPASSTRLEEACPCCSEPEEGEAAATQPPKKPLHWFGELVAPQLRAAEKNFTEGEPCSLECTAYRLRNTRTEARECGRVLHAEEGCGCFASGAQLPLHAGQCC